jgi:hypothetical protein
MIRPEGFAAAFPLGQLLKDKPDVPDLPRRRDQALEMLNPPTPPNCLAIGRMLSPSRGGPPEGHAPVQD